MNTVSVPRIDAKKLFGNPVWYMEVPQRPHDLATRYHNKYAKEALAEAMETWHQHRQGFPEHFKRDARQKFNHFPRSEKYKRAKQRRYHSTVDLIKTGRTQRRMTSQWKLRMSGSASGGNLGVTLILTFPFKGGSGRFRKEGTHQSVTIENMIKELQRFDDDDPVLLAKFFGEAYWRRVEAHRSNRKRIRIPTK